MIDLSQESIAAHTLAATVVVPYACPQAVDREGRFELLELISATQRSWVYKARDTRLSSAASEQMVAVKISRGRSAASRNAISEAQWAAAVDHPAVVRMLDTGLTRDGLRYVVMEWMDGPSLASAPRPDVRTAVRWLADLARAVQAAHSAGVIHCDIKPQNVMLDGRGRPRLTDFDLALAESAGSGAMRGTLAYMAPEQFRREPGSLSPRADVYGLGALAFSLLAGRPPHGVVSEYIQAALLAGANVPVEDLPADVPAQVRRIIARATDPQPANRPQTALQFAQDLEDYLAHRPIEWQNPSSLRRSVLWCRRRPTSFVVATAAVLVTLASVLAWVAVARQEAVIDRQAAEQARQLALLEINKFRDNAANVIASGYKAIPPIDPEHGPVMALALTSWIADSPFITETGTALAVPERRQLLLEFLGKAEGPDPQPSLAAAAARLAMVELELLDKQPAAALATLEVLKRVHLVAISPNDPAHRIAEALRLSALVAQAKTAAERAPHRAELRKLWPEIEKDVRVPRSVKVRVSAAMIGVRGEK